MKASNLAANDTSRPGMCVMPWINLQVTTSGQIAPCCSFKGQIGHLSETTMQAAWQGAKLREVRRQFANGEMVSECWKCAERETLEGSSMRTEMNANFAHWFDYLRQHQNLDEAAPTYPAALDLRFSNLCNFKCRSCWHGASSKWFVDSKVMGLSAGPNAEIRSFNSFTDFITQVGPGLPHLEEIYFAGGEPLIQAEHYALLEFLIERGLTNVRLRYNTNLSVMQFAGRSVFDLWSQFDALQVEASVDASHDRGALLRSGFNWTTFVDNVKELRVKCPLVDLRFGITVSSLNILILPELLRILCRECEATPKQIHLHSLQGPLYYRTQALPTALKRQAASAIDAYLEELRSDRTGDDDQLNDLQRTLRGQVAYMNAADLTHMIPRMKQVTEGLDKLRSEQLEATLPELKPMISHPPSWRTYFFQIKQQTLGVLRRASRYRSLFTTRQ